MNDRTDGRARGISARGASKNNANGVIASRLRALYQAIESEPVPQQFIDLLRRLDEAERAQSGD
ncbi:NepR family anti-sigma factor [Sinorhizobium fredii]|uniref:NepR family anti-sigma factor n=1 Tax=Rhizobium fredii TaxID=380 RepID=UPI0004B0F703|nr:NepR family anti-sigma factor [Sinorhizobium fredii]AWI56074.1 hypothetical protein AB395_0000393 [Sinorhizobium fredii CCBAU 45436]WOS63435.1 NepR family anti-sigma factor [Sinorhizobium fredii GR64]